MEKVLADFLDAHLNVPPDAAAESF
jgi:hypothetical protein